MILDGERGQRALIIDQRAFIEALGQCALVVRANERIVPIEMICGHGVIVADDVVVVVVVADVNVPIHRDRWLKKSQNVGQNWYLLVEPTEQVKVSIAGMDASRLS